MSVRPSGGPTPGALALRAAVHGTYFRGEFSDLGIYNPRDVCGNAWPNWRCAPSLHAFGRAVDFGVRPLGDPKGDRLAAWLIELAPLGVFEIIWNKRRWTPATGWRPYTGRSDHRDHVHVALTERAATTLTADSIRLWFTQEDAMTPEQWTNFQEFRVAVQRNDQNTWAKIDALAARLERIEQAVATPAGSDVVTLTAALQPLLDLAQRLED